VDDALVSDGAAKGHGAIRGNAVRADDQDVFLALIGFDSAITDEDGRPGSADRNADPGEKAGHQGSVRIGEDHAQGERAGFGIEAVAG